MEKVIYCTRQDQIDMMKVKGRAICKGLRNEVKIGQVSHFYVCKDKSGPCGSKNQKQEAREEANFPEAILVISEHAEWRI